jgi:hypothetical protein
MSYCLMAYAVRFDRVQPVFGSGDDKLRRMICGRFKSRLAQRAESFSNEIGNGAPSPFDAVRALIMGPVPEKGHGNMYAYAYETIIEHHGRFLDNGAFSSMRWAHMDAVEEGFKRTGLDSALPFGDLYRGKALCAFPPPDDFPSMGYWSPEQVISGRNRFGEITVPGDIDTSVAESLAAVRGWVNSAGAKGEGIISFYY